MKTDPFSVLLVKSLVVDLQGKEGVWLKLPLEKSELVPIAVKVQL